MLRQKYSRKKRLKKRRKTRKIGGTKNPTPKPLTKKQREDVFMKSVHPDVVDQQNSDAMIRLFNKENEATLERLKRESKPSCSPKARRHPICRTCNWTTDPGALEKCKCCPGSPQSLEAGMDQIIEEKSGSSKSGQPTSKAIVCRHGDNRKKCQGKSGVKKKKKSRRSCRNRGGKVIRRNTNKERCQGGEIELQSMGINCPPDSKRDKHCETVFGKEKPCRDTKNQRYCVSQTGHPNSRSTLMGYNRTPDRYSIVSEKEREKARGARSRPTPQRQEPPPIDAYETDDKDLPLKGPNDIREKREATAAAEATAAKEKADREASSSTVAIVPSESESKSSKSYSLYNLNYDKTLKIILLNL